MNSTLKKLLSSFHKPKPRYRAFRSYWRVYGGVWEIIDSQWFWLAVLATGFLFPLWSKSDGGEFNWVRIAHNVLPSLLGFSIGSISILIAFSSKARSSIHKIRKDSSYYLKLIAGFFHFILLQFSSLISSIIVLTFPSLLLSGVAFFLFFYALLSGVATAAALYGLAEIHDKAERVTSESQSRV